MQSSSRTAASSRTLSPFVNVIITTAILGALVDGFGLSSVDAWGVPSYLSRSSRRSPLLHQLRTQQYTSSKCYSSGDPNDEPAPSSPATASTTQTVEPGQPIEDEDAPAGIVGAEFFGGNKQKQEFYDPEAELRATDNFQEPDATFDRFNSDAFPTDASRRIGLELTAHIQNILYNNQHPISSVYASNLQWTTPLQVESKEAPKSPLDALRAAGRFYRRVDVAITACKPTSSTQFEMHWEIGLTWPIFWAPRVLLCMKSTVALNDQEQIVSQVDELVGGKDLLSLVTSQVVPRFWDVYHIGMTPPAEVSPHFPVGSKGLLPPSYQVLDLPPRWYWQPSLYDVGSRDDSNAAVLPNHGFVTAIRTMGPQKDEYFPASPVEVQLLPVSSSNRLRLQWSVPVAVHTLASNSKLTIPSAYDDDDGDQRNVNEEQPTCEYVWRGARRVATVPFRGCPQDSGVSPVRKALYEQVVRDGHTPTVDRETGRPIFFFWQNTVKACYAQQGLGMAVYEARPSYTKPNRVGIELEL
jgi:hypothetical protein